MKPLTVKAMGRLGGKRRAQNLTAEQRKQQASAAAKARWSKIKSINQQ